MSDKKYVVIILESPVSILVKRDEHFIVIIIILVRFLSLLVVWLMSRFINL